MPGQNVQWPIPLQRLPPWFPGQMGVRGSDTELGLRAHSSGVVLYVDPNHLNANDGNDGTDASAPMLTVAHAITHCQPYRGDVIAVMANNGWQFGDPVLGYATPIREEVIMDVPGVRLVGVASAGTVGVVWEPVTAAGAGTCITITATDCLVEGFSFQGAGLGGRAISIVWDGITAHADNPIIRHCLFDQEIDIGIQLDFVYFADISDCIFLELDAQAIYTDPLDSDSAFLCIHENWFIDCTGGALSLEGADNCLIKSNWIYNTAAATPAAATNLGIDLATGTSNLVCDNYLSCLLPVAAPGDYDDFCTAGAADAWISNHCMNGPTTTNPT